MARLTVKDFNETLGLTNSYDIVNAIRNDASPLFQQYVPLANVENVSQVGAGILLNQSTQNEFITSLVDRIGAFILHRKIMTNVLAKFKRGMLPLGQKIEESFVDLVPENIYDPEIAESEVFKRQIPNILTLFHEVNRQSFYKSTIQDSSLQKAFISWTSFNDFLSGIISSMYNSNQVDEYKYMKLLVDNYYSKGLFKVIPIDPVTSQTSANSFLTKARETSMLLTLGVGSRDFNAMNVHTVTNMEDLHFIVDANLMATVDVESLARAFNIDRASFLGNVTIIDNFASSGLRAIAIDKDFFMIFDQVFKMESIRNTQGLYWNYTLHIWQMLSASRFANAVAFVENSATIPPVTNVIVDPPLTAVSKGKTKQFSATIRQTDDQEYHIVWSVTGATAVNVGTTVSADGLLTIATAETNQQLNVIATVYDSEDVTTDVSSQAVVIVR